MGFESQVEAILERAEFEDSYRVRVSGPKDQPTLSIPMVGSIRLFYTGSGEDHYSVHMLRGEQPGAGSVLYFAALLWVLKLGIKGTLGKLSSDLTLSPDATRARRRFQRLYRSFLYVLPHPDADSVKVHRGDGTDFRRPARSDEASMWRLRKMPPVDFEFV